MAKKSVPLDKQHISQIAVALPPRKCKRCRGQDGNEKDVYETAGAATDAAEFIEKDRGLRLKVYECPHGNGWHLTKGNASAESSGSVDILSGARGLGAVSWELVKTEDSCGNTESITKDNQHEHQHKHDQHAPIVKANCKYSDQRVSVSGKVIEIIDSVNIEKIFKMDLTNTLWSRTGAVKELFDGAVSQITVYAACAAKNRMDSYTILIKKDFIKKNKITKGNSVTLNITGISINNIKVWYCNRI
jgi:hypothetical protein